MKQKVANPWAGVTPGARREPTNTELQLGFPCGPADQALFNELIFRLSGIESELIDVVTTLGGYTPSEADLTQVRKSILRGMRTGTFVADTGTANAVVLAPQPTVVAYVEGLSFTIRKMAANNTGSVTINVSGLGAVPLVDVTGQQLAANELLSGDVFSVTMTGGTFKLQKFANSATTTRRGLVELATDAEAQAGQDSVRAITPDSLWNAIRAADYYVDTGTANAMVVSSVVKMNGTYTDGLVLRIKKAVTNTGAVTLNVNGLGVVNVIDQDGAAVVAGDLRATEIVEFQFNGGNAVLQRNSATAARRGLVELATDAEAIAGTDAVRAVTPASLWRAIRSNSYYGAGGTANAITITPVPALPSYTDGQQFFIRIATTNTGAVTINANGLGALPLLDSNGLGMVSGDLVAGELITVTVFNGGSQFILGKNTLTATQSRRGLIELATNAEVLALTDGDRAATPAGLAALVTSTSQRGIHRFATDAEARARVLATVGITPANLAGLLGVAFRGAVGFAGIPAGNTHSFNPATYGLTSADKILVMIWGAGGGGTVWINSTNPGAAGGAGGCAIGIVNATAETITLGAVGAGQNTPGSNPGGNGGSSYFGASLYATGGLGAAGGSGAGGNGFGGFVGIRGGTGGDVMGVDNYWAQGGSAFMFGSRGLSASASNSFAGGGSASIAVAYDGDPGYCLIFY